MVKLCDTAFDKQMNSKVSLIHVWQEWKGIFKHGSVSVCSTLGWLMCRLKGICVISPPSISGPHFLCVTSLPASFKEEGFLLCRWNVITIYDTSQGLDTNWTILFVVSFCLDHCKTRKLQELWMFLLMYSWMTPAHLTFLRHRKAVNLALKMQNPERWRERN